MSIEAINWALSVRGLTPSAKIILFALANYADEYGKCWPSQGRLSEISEQSVDTVQRRLSELAELGLIERARRASKGSGRLPDLYQLAIPQVAAIPLGNTANEGRLNRKSEGLNRTVAAINQPSLRTTNIEPSLFGDAPKRKTRLPEDWQPSPKLYASAREKLGSPAAVNFEIEKFRNYWIGRGTPMLRWDMTFRNWIISAAERRPSNYGPPSQPGII